MNTGTQAAKEAGNMVDLDSNPTKLIEIVEVAKQQLITRGSLTTFSIANDVAKYFAIIPAIFAATYAVSGESGPLDTLNVMDLGSPRRARSSRRSSSTRSIIPALVPLALHGVRYRAIGATALLRRNLLIYGLGGVILPFIGIKLIDLARSQPPRRLVPRQRSTRFRECAGATASSSDATAGVGKTYPHAPGGSTGEGRGDVTSSSATSSRTIGPRPRRRQRASRSCRGGRSSTGGSMLEELDIGRRRRGEHRSSR